ncbi:nucleolar protein 14 homolog [Homalodisca vitripennis]|uniref:nucleolar protein 14 homolog n=1 Tax=Homalodisca vitripennis TaxID=197043 RepID=UPI001EEA8CC0|nr:nucleolar protein 14 homolog [Homalodisca vitripennis]
MKTKSKVKFQNKMKGQNVPKKLNPFEVHVNRSKHQVLGRKLKSDHGMPGISKNKAIQKRKKTLLQEYKMKDKFNQFIDQRIGSNNKGMTEDDRIMARFAAERMKMFNKKMKFNLSDPEVLTHRGQTLSEIERFDDIRSDDDDDDDRGKSGALKGKFVGEAHFGGGLLTKGKQDRGSLIDELINESKKRKAERQRNKEETLEATEQLDEDWKTLAMMVTSKADTASEDASNAQKKDEYDIVMRRLKFEPQAQATQRLKTDEEIAKEDKEQLEKLEKERLKQLREMEANKYGNHRSADDLDDGFSYEVEDVNDDMKKQNEEADNSDSSGESDAEMASGDDGEEEEEDDDDGSEEGSSDEEEDPNPKSKLKNEKSCKKGKVTRQDKPDSGGEEENGQIETTDTIIDDVDDTEIAADVDTEASDEEECAMDDLTDLMPSVTEETNHDKQIIAKVLAKAKSIQNSDGTEEESQKTKSSIDLDLPYVLNVPDTYESFKELLGRHTVQQQNVIFERLVKSNHPNLEPGNKKKMLRLAEYVMDLVNEGEVTWEAIPTLALHFGGIKEFNREECLKMLMERISTRLDDFCHISPTVPAVKSLVWYILMLMKPQGMEVLLAVSRPVLSLACQLISHADPATSATVSLLCCCLLLQCQDQSDNSVASQLYVKSSSILMLKALRWCIPRQSHFYADVCKFPLSKVIPIQSAVKRARVHRTAINHLSPPPVAHHKTSLEDLRLRLQDLDEEADSPVGDNQVLYCSTVLLAGFVKVYRKYPQSKVLFAPIHQIYKQIKAERYPPIIKQEVEGLQTLLEVLQSAQLPPVVKTAKKPKALRQYEPSFHTVTVGRSQRGISAEQQEEQKLLHKYKHEMKGALRELRRDRAFLANVKIKERTQSDEQRMKKVREILGSAATQQGELRSLKRKK